MKQQIVILANSVREGARCIAGIDVQTGKWIRPVPSDGGPIAWNLRNVSGNEPELMEIVEISVQNSGPDLGCQPENRLLDPVLWQHIGLMSVKDVLKYLERDAVILHNDDDNVIFGYFQTISQQNWKSLQLIRSAKVEFYSTSWEGRKRWRALIHHGGNKLLNLRITDPTLAQKLNRNDSVSEDCILTISLAGPWSPDNIQPERCYKLVAGVIEL